MKRKNISSIESKLKKHRPRKILGRQWMVRAAVAVLLTGEHEPSIVLMRRPIKKGDPWSGDMCLPGGRKDAADQNSFQTAVRETKEEVGLDLETSGRYLGRLSDVLTRAHEAAKPMVVTPYVFAVEPQAKFTLSHEAKEIISIPLAFLAQPGNRKTMRWRRRLVNLRLPCYHYQGARVWGLTLKMLDELLRLSGSNITHVDDWLRLIGLRN